MAKKILYLIETLGHGGAEHQLVASVKLLDRSRFEPIVCFFRAPDYLTSDLTDRGIRVVRLDVTAGKVHWPTLIRRLSRVVRELEPDLLHTSLFEADVVGGVVGKLCAVPVVSTLCNIAGDRVRLADNPRNNWVKFAATNLLWGSALRLLHRHSIAISRAVRDSAATTFGLSPSRMSVIYRGLAPDRGLTQADPTAVRAALGVSDAEPFLLSVGRLAPQKGHKYLIQALPALVTSFPRTKLAIVGEGWLRESLEAEAAALGVAKNVVFLGKRRDLVDLLGACDVFVFPSLFEGLGVSLLEACFAGCACVATKVGPIPEIIEDGETGLLAQHADAGSLERALSRVAGEPDLRGRLGRAARQRMLQGFMLEAKVSELQTLYGELLDQERVEPGRFQG